MEMVLKAATVAVIGVTIGLAVKRTNPEMSLMISTALAAFVLYIAFQTVGGVVEFMREAAALSDIPDGTLAAVLKTLGISVAARLASDVCRDAGQSAAASAVELAGAAGALYTALPLMRSVLSAVAEITFV